MYIYIYMYMFYISLSEKQPTQGRTLNGKINQTKSYLKGMRARMK